MKSMADYVAAALASLMVLGSCGSGGDSSRPPDLNPGWTWVSGSNVGSQTGVYGTRGTGAPSNIPGARQWSASWRDSGGKFWLFGGEGYDETGAWDWLNDLWKYDPASNIWTWVSGTRVVDQPGFHGTKGIPDPANVPGGRDTAACWIDASGSVWLFGGMGFDSARQVGGLNDLWRYAPASDEWTWISGSDLAYQTGVYGTKGSADPINSPGARQGASSWLDLSGKLWLFGGAGLDASGSYYEILNDLWVFDTGSNKWTWVSGSDAIGAFGVYGTKGVADPSNVPGARIGAASWTDSSGRLWLFGGSGVDTGQGWDDLNDLWRFDVATREWTWISGDNAAAQWGIYGTKGSPAGTNVPGAREFVASWIDGQDNLWLFGGRGYDSVGLYGHLNDLWKFNPATLEWTWISGSDTANHDGVYGTKGMTTSSNVPGTRQGASSWIDAQGRLWLFGGYYMFYGPTGSGHFNDLWRYAR